MSLEDRQGRCHTNGVARRWLRRLGSRDGSALLSPPSFSARDPARSSPASQHSRDGGAARQENRTRPATARSSGADRRSLRILGCRRLAATRNQLPRTLHQLLLPAADHRRRNPNSTDSSARVFSPESAAIATRALNSVLLPLYAHLSRPSWTGQPLAYPAVEISGAAAIDRGIENSTADWQPNTFLDSLRLLEPAAHSLPGLEKGIELLK
jgi:hypothetical protein